MKKLSLLRYFTIFSAIAFLITGTYYISNHIKNDKLKNTNDITTLTLNVLLKSELPPEEFNGPFNTGKINLLDTKFKNALEYSDISGIKIWDKKGNILYSNDSSMIGKHYSLTPNITSSLKANSILNIENSQNKNSFSLFNPFEKIIKIYEPIIFDNIVYGAFEVSKPYSEIREHMVMINKTITLIMFFGLLILYLFLLKIILNASKTLVLQNNTLLTQKLILEESYSKLNLNYRNTISTLSKAVDARILILQVILKGYQKYH